eukprot:272669_1
MAPWFIYALTLITFASAKNTLLGNIFPDRKFFTITFGKDRHNSEAIIPENGIIQLLDRDPYECYRYDPSTVPHPSFKPVNCITLKDSTSGGISMSDMGHILLDKNLVLPPLAVTKTRNLALKLERRTIYLRVYPRETYNVIPNDKTSFYLTTLNSKGATTSVTKIPQHAVIKLSYLPLCVLYDAHGVDEAMFAFVESIPSAADSPHSRSFKPFKEVDCADLTAKPSASSMTMGSMEFFLNSGLLTKPPQYIGALKRNKIVIEVDKKPPDLPTPCKLGFGTEALLTRPPHLNTFIQKYGNEPVDSIVICKQPVSQAIAKVLDLLTSFKFSEVKKMAGYTEVYHAFAYFKIHGKSYRFEKNENVKLAEAPVKQLLAARDLVSKGSVRCKKIENSELPSKKKTFRQIMERAEENNKCLYYYNPWHSNCQDFISAFIHHIGLKEATLRVYDRYTRQDEMKKIFERPFVKNIALGLTDVAAMANRILHIAADEAPLNNMDTFDEDAQEEEALIREILMLERKIKHTQE